MTRNPSQPVDLCERTFRFAVSVVRFCHQLGERPGVGRILSHQLLRSGTSIGANVEEAQAAQSRADFVNKYSIALKEARETNYWLRLLVAADVVPATALAELQPEAKELMLIPGASVVPARQRPRA